MKLKALLPALLLPAAATAGWMEFGAGCPEGSEPTTVHNITLDDLISFDVELQGLLADTVSHEGHDFLRFSRSPGTVPMDSTGFPELPVVNCFVAMPDKSRLKLSCSASCLETIGCLPIYPAPLDSLVIDSLGMRMEEFFRIDSGAYASDEWYPPKPAEITGEIRIRDQRVAVVTVCPVQYLASEDSLRVWSDMELAVHFGGPAPVWSDRGLGYYETLVGDRLIGYEHVSGPWHPIDPDVYRPEDLVNGPPIVPDYVIIVAAGLDDELTTAVDMLAQHRVDLNGFNVVVARTDDIYDQFGHGSPHLTPDVIRNFTERMWDWHPEAPMRPTYLLLIGDHEEVEYEDEDWFLPAYEFEAGSSTILSANDSWFAYFDEPRDASVSVPDMIVGRLSFRETSELEDMIDLIQDFEEAEEPPYPPHLQYRRYLTRLSGWQDGYTYDNWHPTFDWTADLTNWMGYTFSNHYCGDGDPNTIIDGSNLSSGQWVDACTDEFERGCQVLFYTDHGGVHYFDCAMDADLGDCAGRPDSTFDDLDVRELSPAAGQEDYVSPFVMLFSCSQNTFNWTEEQQYAPGSQWWCYGTDSQGDPYDFGVDCFAEELMHSPDCRAIGVFGASWASSQGYVEQKEEMIRGIYCLGHTRIGDAMMASRLSALDEYFPWGEPWGIQTWDFGVYNLLGDPAVDIGDRVKFRDCCDLIISPSDLEVNRYPTMSVDGDGEVEFRVMVRNAGWMDAGPFDVRLEITDELNTELITVSCDGLGAGRETTLKFVWDSHIWFTPPGELTLTASATDPGPATPDSWMPNNSASVTMEIEDFYPNDGNWPCQTVWSSLVPPILCDFDGVPGNGLEIIVTADAVLQAYSCDSPGEPFWESRMNELYHKTGVTIHPSIPVAGNVIGDGGVEIIVDGEEALMIFDSGSREPIHSYTHTCGKTWVNVHTVSHADFVSETDQETRDEIVLLRGNELFVFDIVNGSLVPIVDRVPLPNTSGSMSVSAWPMIADVNGTGSPEIVVSAAWGTISSFVQTGLFVYHFDTGGFDSTLWPVQNWRTIPAVGSLPANGQRVALSSGENDDGQNAPDEKLPALLVDTDDLTVQQACEFSPEPSGNILCCIMADWTAPFGEADRILANAENQCFGWYANGDEYPPYPLYYGDEHAGSARPPFPALGELDNEDLFENADLLVATREGSIMAYSSTGDLLDEYLSFPYTLPSSVYGGFAVADIDRDGTVEVVFGTMDNYLHVWELGACPEGYAPWPQCQHDAARTGVLLEE